MPDARPIATILIAGPTASGKSALALALARRLGGVVINADASQVYRDLRILSARPAPEEEAAAKHALYGHIDAAEPYAVGRWLAEAGGVINSLRTRREAGFQHGDHRPANSLSTPRLPIFVGGTGLYFEALTSGLAVVPAIPVAVRERWRGAGGEIDLHAELARRDPVMAARLRPSDPQRLMRALEVIDATGRSLADWQRETAPGPVDPASALRIALAPDRGSLDARIAARLEAMLRDGAREEAERLVARGLDPALPALKALGVAPLAAWARGEIDRATAVERTRLDTRRYAKRQSTWLRNRMADWLHVAPEAALDAAHAEIERRGVAG
jgi:tRNA dimethylallyltransferase